eukprot:ctg_174.g120
MAAAVEGVVAALTLEAPEAMPDEHHFKRRLVSEVLQDVVCELQHRKSITGCAIDNRAVHRAASWLAEQVGVARLAEHRVCVHDGGTGAADVYGDAALAKRDVISTIPLAEGAVPGATRGRCRETGARHSHDNQHRCRQPRGNALHPEARPAPRQAQTRPCRHPRHLAQLSAGTRVPHPLRRPAAASTVVLRCRLGRHAPVCGVGHFPIALAGAIRPRCMARAVAAMDAPGPPGRRPAATSRTGSAGNARPAAARPWGERWEYRLADSRPTLLPRIAEGVRRRQRHPLVAALRDVSTVFPLRSRQHHLNGCYSRRKRERKCLLAFATLPRSVLESPGRRPCTRAMPSHAAASGAHPRDACLDFGSRDAGSVSTRRRQRKATQGRQRVDRRVAILIGCDVDDDDGQAVPRFPTPLSPASNGQHVLVSLRHVIADAGAVALACGAATSGALARQAPTARPLQGQPVPPDGLAHPQGRLRGGPPTQGGVVRVSDGAGRFPAQAVRGHRPVEEIEVAASVSDERAAAAAAAALSAPIRPGRRADSAADSTKHSQRDDDK